jgi:hypothetical protein
MKRFIIGSVLVLIIACTYILSNYHTSKATTNTHQQLKEKKISNQIQINQTEKSHGISLTLEKVKYGKDHFNKDLLEMDFIISSKNIKEDMEKIKKGMGKTNGHLSPYYKPYLEINGKREDFWCDMNFTENKDTYKSVLKIHIKNKLPNNFKAKLIFYNIKNQDGKWVFNFKV